MAAVLGLPRATVEDRLPRGGARSGRGAPRTSERARPGGDRRTRGRRCARGRARPSGGRQARGGAARQRSLPLRPDGAGGGASGASPGARPFADPMAPVVHERRCRARHHRSCRPTRYWSARSPRRCAGRRRCALARGGLHALPRGGPGEGADGARAPHPQGPDRASPWRTPKGGDRRCARVGAACAGPDSPLPGKTALVTGDRGDRAGDRPDPGRRRRCTWWWPPGAAGAEEAAQTIREAGRVGRGAGPGHLP